MLKTVKLLNEEAIVNDAESIRENIVEITDDTVIFADEFSSVQSVRCAAHTLQLAIQDAVKSVEADNTIEAARHVAKKLRVCQR